MTTPPRPDPRAVLIGGWCLAAYLYNTSGMKFAHDMFGDAHPSYLGEKADAFAECPQRALGALDDDHFAKLMLIAYARHGNFAATHAAMVTP